MSGEVGDGGGGLDEGGVDPGGAVGELELEPVAGLVATEEGGLGVLVEAADDGVVGAGAGAEVGAFDDDGEGGAGDLGGGGRGRGGGGRLGGWGGWGGAGEGDGGLGQAGLGDEGGDDGGAEGFVDGFEFGCVAEDADLGGGDPAGGAVGEVDGEPGAVGGAAGYGEGGADLEVGAGGAVGGRCRGCRRRRVCRGRWAG